MQILNKLDLTLRIAGRHRQRQAADLVRTSVEPRAACKQAVAVSDLHNIAFRTAGSHNRAGAAVLPQIDVALRIECNDAFSGSSARRLDTHAVVKRSGQQAVRIRLAQIVFRQKRQLVKIVA